MNPLPFILPWIQVNTNGILSFRFPFSSSFARSFPFFSSPLISPYWDNFDLRRGGNLFYRQTSNITLLQRVRDQIEESISSASNFIPITIFIATWDRVPGFGQTFGLVCNVHTCIMCHLNPILIIGTGRCCYHFTGKNPQEVERYNRYSPYMAKIYWLNQ